MSNAEYYREYNKKYTERMSLNLSREKDQDIIDAIKREKEGNLQGGIKSLIRKGIQYNDQEREFNI